MCPRGAGPIMVCMRTAAASDPHSAGDRVLVLGPGHGDVSLFAARRFCRVTATDFVPEELELTERRAAFEHLPVTVRVSDPQSLPFPDESFDLVIAMAATKHERIEGELLRVCRAGGRIWRVTEVTVHKRKEKEMQTHEIEQRSFEQPDEVREFPNGRAEILNVGGGVVGRFVFEPGWRWSNDVKPIAGTGSCQVQHFQYIISGRQRIRMDDGTEMEFGAGDVAVINPGHDGWVVGDEPVILVDWAGATTYAKQS